MTLVCWRRSPTTLFTKFSRGLHFWGNRSYGETSENFYPRETFTPVLLTVQAPLVELNWLDEQNHADKYCRPRTFFDFSYNWWPIALPVTLCLFTFVVCKELLTIYCRLHIKAFSHWTKSTSALRNSSLRNSPLYMHGRLPNICLKATEVSLTSMLSSDNWEYRSCKSGVCFL